MFRMWIGLTNPIRKSTPLVSVYHFAMFIGYITFNQSKKNCKYAPRHVFNIIDHILSFFMKGHVSSGCGLTKYHTKKVVNIMNRKDKTYYDIISYLECAIY